MIGVILVSGFAEFAYFLVKFCEEGINFTGGPVKSDVLNLALNAIRF